MKEQTREEPKIMAAAERQMHAWALSQEIGDREMRVHGRHDSQPLHPFIAISRETGAGGSAVGELLGARLGWRVCDRNLLDELAERFQHCRMMLDLVDETESSWIYDVLGTWMDRAIVPHEKFVAQLTRLIAAAARQQSCVFVGRGAQFLLPRRSGLAVRLVASRAHRIRAIAQSRHLDQSAAQRHVDQTDRGRREFVQRFFHHDITDPHLYDLVLNTEQLGIEGAAEQIIATVRADARFRAAVAAQ